MWFIWDKQVKHGNLKTSSGSANVKELMSADWLSYYLHGIASHIDIK